MVHIMVVLILEDMEITNTKAIIVKTMEKSLLAMEIITQVNPLLTSIKLKKL